MIHDDAGDWLVSDDIHDPNEDGASHIVHLDLAHDPSLAQLAAVPPGHIATRQTSDDPWDIRLWTDDGE
ncbi:hypothetical protein OG266_01510 [Streptomyces sp. NBC_00554]|uniref:hypothetical protein n=1 Tax=Streptomyces sp. NBC_00554 TaxID=2903661 RepID=UPI00352FDAE1|nr:hypothetical protein OG266_01510 [Streptomyces sp. NBC_00554]